MYRLLSGGIDPLAVLLAAPLLMASAIWGYSHSRGHAEPAKKGPGSPARPAVLVRGTQVRVNETPLMLLKREVTFRLNGIWPYDPERDRWVRILRASAPLDYTITPSRPDEAAKARVLLELPEPVGLYYVAWTEDGEARDGFGFNRPVNCNDVVLGEPPAGKVAACVPSENSATAQFVPDPRLHSK